MLSISVTETVIANHITPATFVFAPFVDYYVLLPLFLKGRDPPLYIGNEVQDCYVYLTDAAVRDREGLKEECNGIGRRFLEGREMVRLGEFSLHTNGLEGLVVFWKKDGDEGDKDGDEEDKDGDEEDKEDARAKAKETP